MNSHFSLKEWTAPGVALSTPMPGLQPQQSCVEGPREHPGGGARLENSLPDPLFAEGSSLLSAPTPCALLRVWCTVINHGSGCHSYQPNSYQPSSGLRKGEGGVRSGGGVGSPTETQRAGDSASSCLPLLQQTWAFLRVFLLVCLRLGRHLLMAKVCSREKTREKLPEICPRPLYHPKQAKARLGGTGPGVSPPHTLNLCLWVNLCAP